MMVIKRCLTNLEIFYEYATINHVNLGNRLHDAFTKDQNKNYETPTNDPDHHYILRNNPVPDANGPGYR